MAEKIIVATFKDQESASRAATAIKELKDSPASKFKLKAGAIVQKDDQGTLLLLKEHDNPLRDTKIGASIGTLIGLLGGPVGAAFGAALGTGAGTIADAVNWGIHRAWVNSVTSDMPPGTTAVIVEADESNPKEVDDIVMLGGGSLHRHPVRA